LKKIIRKFIEKFIKKYTLSDNLSLETRLLNMVSIVGMVGALAAAVTRLVMNHEIVIVLIMFGIVFSLMGFFFINNYSHILRRNHRYFLVVLGDMLFPLAFFFLGGMDSGMTAYFVVSITVIFMFPKSKNHMAFLILHLAVIVGIYYVDYYFPDLIMPPSPIQRLWGNIQSVIIAGLSTGIMLMFQSRLYLLEKRKVLHANKEVLRQDLLLRGVNKTAEILLSTDDKKAFEDTLYKSMALLADYVDTDNINIWRNYQHEGKGCYSCIYSWESNAGQQDGRKAPVLAFSYEDTFPSWERKLSKGESINGPVSSMSGIEIDRLDHYGIMSILVVPVILQEEFWGFVSFADRRNERRFPSDEESILRSSGLLLANAIVRNELTHHLIQAREEALQASKAKTEFLANMSHEMRTSINAITGMTFIAKSAGEIARKDYCLNKIEDASTHLLGVINEILDISKIEANKFELSIEEFDFEKMLQKSVNIINFRTEEKQQHLYVDIDKEIPRYLLGDDQRIAQVITNLLSNAVKFTPEKGSIRLITKLLSRNDEQCVIQIEVMDTGIGINEEQKSRIFMSFEQANSSTSRTFGGTGLGLAISKEIVEMMNGTIRLESEPGKGSVFIFTIQVKEAPEKQGGCLSPNVTWGNIRILAVDDDPEVRTFFKNIAEQLKISCQTAASGEEAVELIGRNSAYDIYFVNWKMPGMNGIELSRRIIGASKSQPVQPVVIMMSAVEQNLMETEAKDAGISQFLSKPLFPSSITDCINECLRVGWLDKKNETRTDNFAGHRILLTEDVDINREIVLTILAATGLDIDCAENGVEALRMFSEAEDAYDLILMDIQMPGMDGYEATRRIRALGTPKAKKIPIIAMTANVFREDIENCLKAGMNDHLGKPLDLEDTMEKLRKYLN
jgi:signal transduction histidine kinase/DNA-binding response OmpR family regulator